MDSSRSRREKRMDFVFSARRSPGRPVVCRSNAPSRKKEARYLDTDHDILIQSAPQITMNSSLLYIVHYKKTWDGIHVSILSDTVVNICIYIDSKNCLESRATLTYLDQI